MEHEEHQYLRDVPELDPGTTPPEDTPLWKFWKESEPRDYPPFLFDEGQRRKLDAGVGVTVLPRRDFTLSKAKLERVLKAISAQQVSSGHSLRITDQYDYQGKVDPGEIDVREMVGVNFDPSWAGLVDGIGKPAGRTSTMKEVYRYARFILKSGPYRLKDFIKDIRLEIFEEPTGQRRFYVEANGRHRMLTFLALSEMGCEVRFSNMSLPCYKRRP